MNSRSCLTKICLLLLLAALSLTLSTTPQFEVTNKYIEAGAAVLSTATYYGNPASDTLIEIYYICTFTRVITSYNAVSSIQSLEYDISANNRFNVTTQICAYYTNGLDICLLSMSISQIQRLSTRYLVIDTDFTKITHFYSSAKFYVQNAGQQAFDSSNPIVYNYNVPAGLDMTGTVRAFVMFNGFNATASSSAKIFDIRLTASFISATVLQVRVQSSTATVVQFNSIIYSVIGYNENAIQQWPFPAGKITLGTFTPSSALVDTNSTFQTYNTFWGLIRLSIQNDNFLEFDTSLTANVSLSCSTTNTASTYQWQAMIFQFKECHTSTPYYLISSNTCYDDCPNGYYESAAQMTCETCNIQCLTCTGSTNNDCVTCPAGRIINGTSCPTCTQAAGPGCSNCMTSGASFVCTACVGSTLTNSTCVFSPIQSSPSLLLILLVSIGGGLLLCSCCIIVFCCWRRRKNQEKQVQKKEAEKNEDVINKDQRLPQETFTEQLPKRNMSKKSIQAAQTQYIQVNKRRLEFTNQNQQVEQSMEQFQYNLISGSKKEMRKKGQKKSGKIDPMAVVGLEGTQDLTPDHEEIEAGSFKRMGQEGQKTLLPRNRLEKSIDK